MEATCGNGYAPVSGMPAMMTMMMMMMFNRRQPGFNQSINQSEHFV